MKLEIKGPDGKTVEVDAPDGADPVAVARQVSDKMGWNKSAEKNEELNTARIAGTAVAQGLGDTADAMYRFGTPMGMANTGQDVANWILRETGLKKDAGRLPGQSGTRVSPTYLAEKAGIPLDPAAEAKRLGAEMTPTRKMLAQALRAGTGAASFGAGTGFSALSALGAGVGEGIGGDTGAIIGSLAAPVALPAAARSIGAGTRAAGNVARDTTAPFTERGLQGMADRAIVEASGTTPQALAAALKENPMAVPASLGQRTGNRGLLDAEYALHGKVPDFEDAYRATSRIAGEEMGTLAASTERGGSEGLRKALTNTYRKEKAMVTPDIESVKQSLKTIEAKGTALGDYVNKYTAPLSQARQQWLRDAGLGDLKALANGEKVALNEIDDVLAGMKAKVREMPAGSPEKREVGLFVQHMQDGMQKIVPGMGPAYRQYAQFKADFDGNKLIGRLFQRHANGTFKIPPSEIGDAIRKMPAEALELAASTSPEIKRAGKEWLASAWREYSATRNAATRADGTPNFAGAIKFRQENDAAFRAFMDKADLKRSDQIVKALEGPTLPDYGQRRFGSPTYNKFQKTTLLEGVMGRVLGHIPGGAMLNNALGSAAYSKAIQKLDKKIAEALLNPESTIARLLTMPNTPTNGKKLAKLLDVRTLPVAASALSH